MASFGLEVLRERTVSPDFGTVDDRRHLAELRASAAAAIRADPSAWPRPTWSSRLRRRGHAMLEATALERSIRRRRGLVEAVEVERPPVARTAPTVVHAIHALTMGGAQQLVVDLVSDPDSGLRHETIASKVPFPRTYAGLRARVLECPNVAEVRDRLRRVRASVLHLAHYHHPTDDRWRPGTTRRCGRRDSKACRSCSRT